MTSYSFSFGDVVLVPFPFTDQRGSKRRPAVIVSTDRYHLERPDLILLPITSQVRSVTRFGDVPVSNIQVAGLLQHSMIKPVLLTIEASLVLRTLGRLDDDDQRALRHALAQIVG